MKQIILNISDDDKVELVAEDFNDSIESLEEVFHILVSGTRMIATKVEELKSK